MYVKGLFESLVVSNVMYIEARIVIYVITMQRHNIVERDLVYNKIGFLRTEFSQISTSIDLPMKLNNEVSETVN